MPLLDPTRHFGSDHPLEIKVGCGKGLFFPQFALAFSEVNFLSASSSICKYHLFACRAAPARSGS